MGLGGLGLLGSGCVLREDRPQLLVEVSLQFLSEPFAFFLGFRLWPIPSCGGLAPEKPKLSLDLGADLGGWPMGLPMTSVSRVIHGS